MTLKTDAKFEEKRTCGLENGMKNSANFYQSTRKSQNCDFESNQNPYIQSRKYMSLKFTEELIIRTMKNSTKLEEELNCHFKSNIRNLMNFDPSIPKSQKFAL